MLSTISVDEPVENEFERNRMNTLAALVNQSAAPNPPAVNKRAKRRNGLLGNLVEHKGVATGISLKSSQALI